MPPGVAYVDFRAQACLRDEALLDECAGELTLREHLRFFARAGNRRPHANAAGSGAAKSRHSLNSHQLHERIDAVL